MVDSELDLVIDITLHLPKLRLICQVLVSNKVNVILKDDFILGAQDFTMHYSAIGQQLNLRI